MKNHLKNNRREKFEQSALTVSGQLVQQAKTQGDNLMRKLALTGSVTALAGGTTAALATLGLAQYLVESLTKPSRVTLFDSYNFSPFEFQVDYEEVEFPTVGNRLLAGWFLKRPNSRKVVVAVNGYRGRKEDMLGIAVHLWRADYNVLLFNYRGYAGTATKDDVLTLGHRELEDFNAAVSYVKKRIPNAIIGAAGGSMGAAIAIVGTARDPEIRAVWADSSFATQHEVICYNFTQTTHLPAWPVVNISETLFEWRTGHRYQQFAPVNEIGKIGPRPVFLLHGENDSIIPIKHAYKLYEAATGPKEIWIDDHADHCGIYFSNREKYTQRLLEFFGNAMREEKSVIGTNIIDYNQALQAKLAG